MNAKSKAYLVGGGIGSLAAAVFMIRGGSVRSGNTSILEAAPFMGGSLDERPSQNRSKRSLRL